MDSTNPPSQAPSAATQTEQQQSNITSDSTNTSGRRVPKLIDVSECKKTNKFFSLLNTKN